MLRMYRGCTVDGRQPPTPDARAATKPTHCCASLRTLSFVCASQKRPANNGYFTLLITATKKRFRAVKRAAALL